MKIDVVHIVLIVLLIIVIGFLVKLDLKLSVCPITGDIPCKCDKGNCGNNGGCNCGNNGGCNCGNNGRNHA